MDPLIKTQRLRTSASLHSEHSFSGEANGHRAALVSETSFWVNAPSENIAGSRIRTRPLHGRYIGAVPTPQISANLGLLLVGVAGFEPATPSSRTRRAARPATSRLQEARRARRPLVGAGLRDGGAPFQERRAVACPRVQGFYTRAQVQSRARREPAQHWRSLDIL